MRIFPVLVAVIGVIFGLIGCDQIAEQIENSTERTITVSETIDDDRTERDIHAVTLLEGVTVKQGQVLQADPVVLEHLYEAIQTYRLDLDEVQFHVRCKVVNQSSGDTVVTLAGFAVNGDQQPVKFGTVHVAGEDSISVIDAYGMDQEAEFVDAAIKEMILGLDDGLTMVPVLMNKDSGGAGALVEIFQIVASPVILKDEEYKEDLSGVDAEVYATKIEGSITNLGDSMAYVSIFIGVGDVIDPVQDIVAFTELNPGQTVDGETMTLEGGNEKIKSAVKRALDGRTVIYDFVVTSDQVIKIQSDNLRFEGKAKVKANLF